MIRLMNQNNLKLKPNRFRGLSSDKKPTERVKNGDVFFELDTQFLYMYDVENETWTPVNFADPTATMYNGIEVTNSPELHDFQVGDMLDLSDISISLVNKDGTTTDITAECTFDPADGATLTMADNQIDVYYEADNGQKLHVYIPIRVYELESIEIVSLPNTRYTQGDYLDLTGLRVFAFYTNGMKDDVDILGITADPMDLSELTEYGKQPVYVYYAEYDKTVSAMFNIFVDGGVAYVGSAIVGQNKVGEDMPEPT